MSQIIICICWTIFYLGMNHTWSRIVQTFKCVIEFGLLVFSWEFCIHIRQWHWHFLVASSSLVSSNAGLIKWVLEVLPPLEFLGRVWEGLLLIKKMLRWIFGKPSGSSLFFFGKFAWLLIQSTYLLLVSSDFPVTSCFSHGRLRVSRNFSIFSRLFSLLVCSCL